MAAIVFASRYLFLEPSLPVKINAGLQHLLDHSSIAILTAIWAPIVFLPDQELWISTDNPYLIAGITAFFIAWVTKSVLSSIALSMVVYVLLVL
jgi:branched-subunit amino acid transport protein